LECGDVVLVARPFARPDGGGLAGRLEVLFGDGVEALVVGRLGPGYDSDAGEDGAEEVDAAAGGAGAALSLLIEEVRRGGGGAPAAERFNMSEMAEDGQEGAAGVALEDLWLTVRVELASRRIGLEELARLRIGQLLELGCKATDPVDLVLDGRRVARGELVDIEGQLGVRVTQLSG
jgi:type III secretion system YscQ/HrcQ family protein